MRKLSTFLLILMVMVINNFYAQTFDWVQPILESGENYTKGVANDKLGNTYRTGNFLGTINVGNSITLTSVGTLDIFIIKYDAFGNVLWAKSAGGTADDQPNSIVSDSYGNVYITGSFSGNLTVGNYQMTSFGDKDIFIIKFTPEGDLDWAQQAGGISNDEGMDLAVDKFENIYITGYFNSTAQFGKAPSIINLTSAGGQDVFYAKYDPFGILLWVKGGTGNDYNNRENQIGQAITVSIDDNVYLAINNLSANASHIYKLAGNDGNSLWTNRYDLNGKTVDIAVDKNNNCFVVHYYDDSFGRLVKINGSSNYPILQFYKNLGSGNGRGEIPTGIALDTDDEIYIVGNYVGDFSYNGYYIINTLYSSDNKTDCYLLKVANNGLLRWMQRIYDSEHNSQYDPKISVNNNGFIFLSTNFDQRATVGRTGFNTTGKKSLLTKLTQNNPFDVIYPDGGEKFRIGDVIEVKFNNQNAYQMDLLYTTDNGISWTVLKDNKYVTINENTENWTLPNTPSFVCKVAVREHSNYGLQAYSNNVFTLARLNITAPGSHSSSYLPVSTTQTIKWESVNIDKIKIEYSTDNGSTWITVTDTVSGSAQKYDWSIPNTLTNQARIRLSDAAYPSIKTISGTFAIVPYLNILSPNGGEIWQIGTNQEIRWNSVSAQKIKLEYTTNNGSTWLLIDSNTVASVGKFTWNVPKTPSDNCKIKISDNIIAQSSDVSDQNFKIPIANITVTDPTIGDSWLIGSTQKIKWVSYGVDNVRIQYSLNNGITNYNIATSVPANTQSYDWVVPNLPTKQLRIKVLDASNSTLFGWSMANNISPIVLSNFRGGEYVNVGEITAIKWAVYNINKIKIEYTTNNGINWIKIADSLSANVGQYNWTVPNTQSNICKIRISDSENINSYDISKSTFNIVSRVTQKIPLNAGWNLISGYVKARFTEMDSILAKNKSNIIIMKNRQGQIYFPAYNINSIGNWAVEEGYLTKVSALDTLTITGSKISPELYPINIPAGWSMISYLRTTPVSVATVMQSLLSKLIIVKDGSGNIYYPSSGVNSIGNMIPGRGYQVKFNADAVLTYPANSSKEGLEELKELVNLEHFTGFSTTDKNCVIIFEQNSIKNIMKIGDEIGVFSTEGILVGASKYLGESFAVTVWGDDATTTLKDGMLEEEPITLKVWNKIDDIENLLTDIEWNNSEGKYKTDGILTVGTITSLEENLEPINYKLLQNYPNPFNPKTIIGFSIPENAKVELEVYNVLGEKVAILVNKEMITGNYSIEFDATQLSSGIYFYKLATNNFVSVKKMMLIK